MIVTGDKKAVSDGMSKDLGVSRDGYVHDPKSVHPFRVAEIEWPYEYRGLMPEDAVKNYDFAIRCYKRQALQLKRSQQSYSQVQDQLTITQRMWCDFIIYNTKGTTIEITND